jgi:hypothetical protein
MVHALDKYYFLHHEYGYTEFQKMSYPVKKEETVIILVLPFYL